MTRSPIAHANLIALVVPAALLGGALSFQYIGGLYPCEMCWWQRYPHGAAIVLAALALAAGARPARRWLVAAAGLAVAVSGAIGVYHAGVEQKWWQGITACSAKPIVGSPDEMLRQILATPIVRCDAIPWSWLGISMAGWNAIISLTAAGAIAWLITRPR